MKNRDLLNRKVDQIDQGMEKLKRMVRNGAPIEDFISEIEILQVVNESIGDMIEGESINGRELNNLLNQRR